MTEPVDSYRQPDDDPESIDAPEYLPVNRVEEDAPIPLPDGIHDSRASDLPDTLVDAEEDSTAEEIGDSGPSSDEQAESEEFTPSLDDHSQDEVEADSVVKDTITAEIPEQADDTSTPNIDEVVTSPPTKASTGSRFRRMLGQGTTKGDQPTTTADETLDVETQNTSAWERIVAHVRVFFDPGIGQIDTTWHRRLVAAVLVVILILLAANQAGAALIVGSSAIPVLIVMLLTRYDIFERESNLILAGLGAIGIVVGIVLGSLVSWVYGSQWFNQGHLNFGAGGFGSNFADGSASLLVWVVAGLLIPSAIVVGIVAAPMLLRRKPQFANEVMDGVTLAGASAAGIAIGLAGTFWYPMVSGDGPLMNVSDWTLMIVGQVLLRPIVITLSGAMIGAGVWRYMLTSTTGLTAVLPTVTGVVGIFLLWMGSVGTQASGIWMEFQLTLFLALLVFVLYRHTLVQAIETDSLAMGSAGERIVCPHCHQVTPVGTFCARCGQPLKQ